VYILSRSRWPRGLRRGSAAARLLGLRVRIPSAAWMSVCCECCVLSGRGLCDELITRLEESHRIWCVWVWSWSLCNKALAHWGLLGRGGILYIFNLVHFGLVMLDLCLCWRVHKGGDLLLKHVVRFLWMGNWYFYTFCLVLLHVGW